MRGRAGRAPRLEHGSVPDPETIDGLAAERAQLRAAIATAESEMVSLGGEVERLQRDIDRTQQALARLLEEDAEAALGRDDCERLLHHSAKVRGTLQRFREAVVARHVRRIEELVL